MINDYREYFLNRQVLSLYGTDAMLHSHEQHEAILQAVQVGAGAEAERKVREHFQDAMTFVLHEAGDPGAPDGSQPELEPSSHGT